MEKFNNNSKPQTRNLFNISLNISTIIYEYLELKQIVEFLKTGDKAKYVFFSNRSVEMIKFLTNLHILTKDIDFISILKILIKRFENYNKHDIISALKLLTRLCKIKKLILTKKNKQILLQLPLKNIIYNIEQVFVDQNDFLDEEKQFFKNITDIEITVAHPLLKIIVNNKDKFGLNIKLNIYSNNYIKEFINLNNQQRNIIETISLFNRSIDISNLVKFNSISLKKVELRFKDYLNEKDLTNIITNIDKNNTNFKIEIFSLNSIFLKKANICLMINKYSDKIKLVNQPKYLAELDNSCLNNIKSLTFKTFPNYYERIKSDLIVVNDSTFNNLKTLKILNYQSHNFEEIFNIFFTSLKNNLTKIVIKTIFNVEFTLTKSKFILIGNQEKLLKETLHNVLVMLNKNKEVLIKINISQHSLEELLELEPLIKDRIFSLTTNIQKDFNYIFPKLISAELFYNEFGSIKQFISKQNNIKSIGIKSINQEELPMLYNY